MRKMKKAKSLNIKGKLVTLDEPWIMGILNVTPDSFFAGSRRRSEDEILRYVESALSEGATILDVGGYSSRPGADSIFSWAGNGSAAWGSATTTASSATGQASAWGAGLA